MHAEIEDDRVCGCPPSGLTSRHWTVGVIRVDVRIVSIMAACALATASTAAFSAPIVYVPLGPSNEIAIVDAASGAVTGRIADVANPHGLAATPDSAYLVAGTYAESKAGDAAPPPKPGNMSDAEHERHHRMDDDKGAGSAATSYVSLIRVADGHIERRIPVVGAVHHTAVSPDGRHALATHPMAGGVSLIDLERATATKMLPTGPLPNYAVSALRREQRRSG